MLENARYKCVSLDTNKRFVRLALHRVKLHDLKSPLFIVGDINALPLRSDLFNVVIMYDVIFAVNLYDSIGEIVRVLKRDGKIIFDAHLALFYSVFPFKRPSIKYRKKDLLNSLNNKGLRQEHALLVGMPPVLHEHFHLPERLMRFLSKSMISMPNILQELLSNVWFAALFIARYDLD